jgi:hypothetical protein
VIRIEQRKKNVLFIVSVLILLFLFYGNDFGITSTVGDLQVTESEYHQLTEERKLSELENTFHLKVNDYVLPYDEKTDSFLFSVGELEEIDESNLMFEIVMDKNLDYEIALLDYTLTEESIENNEAVKLLVYSEDKYDEFDIYLTSLPILSLDVEKPVSEEGPIGVEYQKASMSLYHSKETIQSDLYIRIRGGSSRAFPKNQYRIKLREFTISGEEKLNLQSLLGMREDDDWIIYSPYNDPEKARNTFSNNLWHDTMADENRFNINTGTEGKYVEIFINNRYWGLYTLMHPIDNKQLDLDIENNVEDSEIYYRSISNVGFTPQEFENSTGDEQVLGRFELREPDEPFGEPEQWQPLYEHMMMRQANLKPLENYLFERTDIDNQINYYLFTMLLQATDNNLKNHNYISKFDGDTRIMLESPWDLDLTWGLHWHSTSPLLAIFRGDPTLNYVPSATLIHSAIQKGSTQISQMVKDKYRELRANEWSEASLMHWLDEYEEDIYYSGAIRRDKERWPDTAYNEDMEQLRTYILIRLEVMDDFIANDI